MTEIETLIHTITDEEIEYMTGKNGKVRGQHQKKSKKNLKSYKD